MKEMSKRVAETHLQRIETSDLFDHQKFLSEDIDDPNRTKNCLVIAVVALCLLAVTVLMGFSHG